MYDIVLVSVPYIDYTAPPAAPAALKGYLNQFGYRSLTRELNIEFRNFINDTTTLGELHAYWVLTVNDLRPEVERLYHRGLDKFARELCSHDSRWIGLSVFTEHSQRFVRDILPYIKVYKKDQTRVVLGGYGCKVLFLQDVKHLIDAYILGEGELSLKALLEDQWDYPGINKPNIQIDDLDQLGHADYTDYDLTAGYASWYKDSVPLPITGSRGCIKDCTYCTVRSIWNKFRYRSGPSIAAEIIENHQRHNVLDFRFTDSLINGNVRELMRMMEILAEYRQRTGQHIRWGGQWITRSKKGLPKDYYALIAASGGYNIAMGVESGSESVRRHMGKNFTNQDLDDEMENFSIHGISCAFFLILGYPTESEQDFIETLRMIRRYTKYVADGTLVGLNAGMGFVNLEGMPAQNMNLFHTLDGPNGVKWVSNVSNNNWMENNRRRLMVQALLNDLEWPITDLEFEFGPVLQYQKILFDPADKPLIKSLITNRSLQLDSGLLAPRSPTTLDIEIELQGHNGSDCPLVAMAHNGHELEQITVDSTVLRRYHVAAGTRRNIFSIELLNKMPGLDTELDEQGTIVRDKRVLIKAIVINGVRLRPDDIALQSRFRKTGTKNTKRYLSGLYENGTLKIYFENPVEKWFIKQRDFYYAARYQENKQLIDQVAQLYTEYVDT